MKELKRKLIFSYTVITGTILTAVVILTLLASFRRENENRIKIFYDHFSTVANRVQFGSIISNAWVVSEENKNNLSICIEENGIPLQLKRSKEREEIRRTRTERLREYGRQDSVSTDISLASVNELLSEVYRWKEGDSVYYGRIGIYLAGSGFRSLLLVEEFENSRKAEQYLLYVMLELGGLFLLYAASVWFVRISIQPVEESKRRQDAFVAAISHELRSPLAVILAHLTLLNQNSGIQDAVQREYAGRVIHAECNRMAVLMEDMLLLAAADTGSWKMRTDHVETEHLLIELYEEYQLLCRERGIFLRLELPEEEVGNILGDRVRCQQILSILLDNAIRFTPEGREIIIRGRKIFSKKARIEIEIEDHGCGISPEIRERVFDRFYQGDASRSEKGHFGLGLSIAKELVTVQKGRIRVEETKGGGSTFILSFLEVR